MTTGMNVAVYFAEETEVLTLAAPEVEVSVAGSTLERAQLETLENEMSAWPRATFSMGLGSGPEASGDIRLEDAAPGIYPGQAVEARLLRGGVLPGAGSGDLVLFAGTVTEIEMALGPEGESLRFSAEDASAQALRKRIGGQRIETASGAAETTGGLDLVFNPDGRPNASPDPYDPGDAEPYTIFAPAGSADAEAWTLAGAVAYVLSEHASGLDVPSPEEVRAALPDLVIRDVSVEGLALGEALEALLEPVGGHVTIAAQPGKGGVSRRLELWMPGRAPAANFAHQPVGAAFEADRTHLAAFEARMDFAASPRRYVARGDRKLYESTFDLVAGWDDSLASYEPRDFSPDTNASFDGVRDVFRKWVLNEAGDYSDAPYSRGPAPDLADLFEGEPYVRRRRRFLACLSRDDCGRGRGIHLEVSLDTGQTWQPMTAAARVLEGECGIYLTDDLLPAAYLRACIRGEARVRATATIASDSRLAAEYADSGAEDLPGRTRHLAAPAGYRYRKVAASSRFYGSEADEADDSARLAAFVRAAFEADRRCPAPTSLHIPYLALAHTVGTRVEGIRGRPIDLAREHTGYATSPVIRTVRWRFWPEVGTELVLA